MRTEPARRPERPAAERQTLTHCPLCRHEHFTYQFTQGGLPIVRCDGCRLLMRNPQPSDDELAAIYGDDYFFGTSATPGEDTYEAEFARLKQATAAGYLDRVERYLGWDSARRRGTPAARSRHRPGRSARRSAVARLRRRGHRVLG